MQYELQLAALRFKYQRKEEASSHAKTQWLTSLQGIYHYTKYRMVARHTTMTEIKYDS